jgi:uncharacterized protein YecA (UPF0149 family)
MDKKTGRIYRDWAAGVNAGADPSQLVEMNEPPTIRQQVRGHVGRNELCPCGSGKKFKKCCHGKSA